MLNKTFYSGCKVKSFWTICFHAKNKLTRKNYIFFSAKVFQNYSKIIWIAYLYISPNFKINVILTSIKGNYRASLLTAKSINQ